MGPPVAPSKASSTSPDDRAAATPNATYTSAEAIPMMPASHQTGPCGCTAAPRTTVPASTTTAACTGTSATTKARTNEITETGSRRTGA